MRFKRILEGLLFVGLCLCLLSGGLWWPVWSPDGTRIAFVSNRNGGFIQIHVMDADGKNPIRLTDAVWDDYPTWSPDGTKIAFSSSPDGKMIPHIAVMDADGENLVMLEGHGTEPSWSPDGGEIAFISRSDGIEEIYVIGEDGHGLKRVTNDFMFKGSPSWSPDGRRIAYWGEENGFFQIYVVRADGRNRTRLTRNREHHWLPAWSPDGRTIAYVCVGGRWSPHRNDTFDDRRWKIP